MIRAYLTFCSVVYNFYVRRKDTMPGMYSFGASSLMLFANVFGLYDVVMFYFLPELPFSTNLVYFSFFVICLVNYFLVFKFNRFEEITPGRNSGIYSVLYIIISILILIWISNKHRDRNILERRGPLFEQN